MSSTGILNQSVARHMIQELIRLGVRYFCIAPGSRSSPLVTAVAEESSIPSYVHFDERALGFHALGYAKAKGEIACVIVTSGTAVANLLPATIEAEADHIPLLILSGDRPPELHGCGANQTCAQKEMLAPYCRYHVELPPPSDTTTLRYLEATLSHAVFQATGILPGPVHINCPFRDPLLSSEIRCLKSSLYPPLIDKTELKPSPAAYEIWKEQITESSRIVCVLGSLPIGCDLSPLLALSQRCGFPIIPSLLSQGRGLGPTCIPFYESLITTSPPPQADCILHVGDRILSKPLQTWLEAHKEVPYLQITSHTQRRDPAHLVTHRTIGMLTPFFHTLLSQIPPKKEDSYLTLWQKGAQEISEAVATAFSLAPLSTGKFFFDLNASLPEKATLFLGNSLPVRRAESFLFTPSRAVFSLRGVSGIDGNLATATGIAQGIKGPVIAVIGDQTLLHDLTSLKLVHDAAYPLHIYLLNNRGGQIFSSLPVKTLFPHLMERFFTAAHTYTFEHAAALFDLPYFCETSKEAQTHSHSALIEVPIQPENETLALLTPFMKNRSLA